MKSNLVTMWVEKHRPNAVCEMVGNEVSRLRFIFWLQNWESGDKPALLIGPPGTGKTTLVYAASNELGYRVLELNASDVRTKGRLELILGPLLSSTNLLGEKQLIFLDEVDGISGRQDYGGLEFLEDLIDKSVFPIVMAANREEPRKMRKILARSEVMKFKRITPRLIELYLKHILRKEGLDVHREILEEVVRVANGDMRAAINTLQSIFEAGKEALILQSREIEYSMQEGFGIFFNTETPEKAYEALESIEALPREKIRAIYTSIVNASLNDETRLKLFDELSKADELVRQIEKTQEWRMLRYFNRILAYRLFSVMPRGVIKYVEDDLPWNLKLRIWNDSGPMKEVCKKLARLVHISSRDSCGIYLPYLILLMSRIGEVFERASGILDLDDSAKRVVMKEMDKISKMVQ